MSLLTRVAVLMLTASTCATLFASALMADASAQPAGGALIGRVVLCRDNFAPIAAPSTDEGPLLQDVPSPGGGGHGASVMIPVRDVLVAVDGTTLSTRTDDNGRFTLVGVPVAIPLSLSLLQQPDAPPLTQVSNVVVNQGQTFDLGTLVLGGEADSLCTS